MKIRFRAKLNRPKATSTKAVSWTFLTLPKAASAKLPSRGMASVEGTINGQRFRATLEPDGNRSHWLKVSRTLREAAGAEAGDVVTLEISATEKEPEPRMPSDLRKALAVRSKGACGVEGHHAHCAQGLDPVDRLRQAPGDPGASGRQCLLDARRREAAHLLLRSLGFLQQGNERA